MRIVLTYARHADWADDWYASVAAAAPEGINVVALPAGPREKLVTFPELDHKWKSRDAERLAYYEAIQRECEDADVLFAYGAGIHPEFLKYLPTFNCYFFCDDPEDSAWQSAKVATAFDAACHANIASGFQYESWGCRRHAWLPIFTSPSDVPKAAEKEAVLQAHRAESIVFVGGLDDYSSYRGRRLERFAKAFPGGVFRGRGWPAGGVDDHELTPLYLRSRIGFNCHRTTGPINRRMFQLSAHGVMQICDNKTGLGQIFELGKEAAGFDTIDEAIELTNYFLEHEAERELVARAGYERFWKDYHARANWTRLRDKLLEWGVKPGERKRGAKQELPRRNAAYFVGKFGETASKEAARLIRSAKAAKREYLRKDPWWKVYDRVFTDESVYLPEVGDPLGDAAEGVGSEAASPAMDRASGISAEQGAARWAATQLVGAARRVLICDPVSSVLAGYVRLDATREVSEITSPGDCQSHFDLLLCVEAFSGGSEALRRLKDWSKVAPRAVYVIPARNDAVYDSEPRSPHSLSFGEAYWLLKERYDEVRLYRMPDPSVPWLEPAGLSSTGTFIIAEGLRPERSES